MPFGVYECALEMFATGEMDFTRTSITYAKINIILLCITEPYLLPYRL